MTTQQYITNITNRYKLGNATEHTFRGDLQQLIESLMPNISATNEPKRQSCGAPDYILTQKEIPIGFIEAKDIGDKDLDGAKKTGNKEQFDRYKASLNNLIFTDYLNFHLYRDGQFVMKIAIAELTDNGIKPLPENYSSFERFIKDFCTHIGQTIKSSKQLAEMMANKARMLAEIIEKALISDEVNYENSTLKDQMTAFKQILIHDITPKGFADVYAQTIAYGMFAARLHDPTLETFSRQEAAELIPKSNPFLRKLFGYIAGPDLDDRIKWIVDSLVDIFLACNVEEILKSYGKQFSSTSGGGREGADPIIHFYETFLSEYDPALRKARGVWYTPAPVVNFIVRAVDDILKTEFDLPQGLADNSKTKIKVDVQGKKVEQEVHRVQILDPATGTGTFLAETIKHIHKKFQGQQGIWSNYVEKHLLPRLNGFELLMASYAMAHLQLDLLLAETGYKPTTNQRLRVYLTNSLEEASNEKPNLYMSQWLTDEAAQADIIKRDTPIMCVIGNPPYSGESANKGEWIMSLMEDYKKEPGGIEKLKERNPKWINDDYVKFLRYGQYFIKKNGSGVLAFINPHGFLDNPTFRGMRWNLLKTYDKIYTIDLHGNSKKKEISPDGTADQNVFDIMQGVSINIFVKTGIKKAKELGKVFHFDVWGKRDIKYDFLFDNTLKDIKWNELIPNEPDLLFIPQDFEIQTKYKVGFSLKDLFLKSSVGVQTHRDELVIDFSKENLNNRLKELFTTDNLKSFAIKYEVTESNSWSLDIAIKKEVALKNEIFRKITYRPFDERSIYYSDNFVDRTRKNVGKEIVKENLVLNFPKIVKVDWCHSLITKSIPTAISMDINGTYFAPLYLYPETNGQQTIGQSTERTPNLNATIVKQIADKLGLTFTNEKETTENTFAPIDLLDYIYAVLHSPIYREKYKEFLKIDFPRVPYPKDKDTFGQLVKLGGQIRQIHLLESPIVEQYITQYPIDGNNVVVKPHYENSPPLEGCPQDGVVLGKVYINDTQYFANVPQIAWEFYIGGYQPAQKWLKDRKGRTLEFDDILHYQKIIVALTETDRLMKEIDTIAIE